MAADRKLPMIDETLAQRIDEILNDTDKAPMKTQISLILALSNQTQKSINRVIEGVNGVMDRQDIANGRTHKLEGEIEELKKKNIVNWIMGNPKLAITFFLIGFFALEVIANEFTSEQNINFVISVLKKWLGI